MTLTAPAPGAQAPGAGRVARPRFRVPTTISHYLVWAVTLLLVVGPVVPIALASLWSTPLYESGGHFTLANYGALLTDSAWWGAVFNSFLFATLTTTMSVALGIGAAVLLSRTNVPFRGLFSALFVLPVTLPGLVLLVGWMAAWSPSGYVTSWLELNTVLT